jgi:pimeloyl-ACP methyl ester carboxylesterase
MSCAALSAQGRTGAPTEAPFVRRRLETPRHHTAWIETGPPDGPLMIFVHGWPQIGLLWAAQLNYFAETGWRCIAPDMRGYGESSVPATLEAYAMHEVVADMLELHDALGGSSAVWVGHDWGSPVVASIAAQHPGRCRGAALISVPYFPRGFAASNLLPLVDRTLYPADRHPVGQWDYILFYHENFDQAAADLEADIDATVASVFRSGSADTIGKPSPTATVRSRGGRFGAAHRAPSTPRDPSMMSQAQFDALTQAFRRTGFRGAGAWYMNDQTNTAYAETAPDGGRLNLPVLFLNGLWDPICDVSRSPLGQPMRDACADLTITNLNGGHWLMLERSAEVNEAIGAWLLANRLVTHGSV